MRDALTHYSLLLNEPDIFLLHSSWQVVTMIIVIEKLLQWLLDILILAPPVNFRVAESSNRWDVAIGRALRIVKFAFVLPTGTLCATHVTRTTDLCSVIEIWQIVSEMTVASHVTRQRFLCSHFVLRCSWVPVGQQPPPVHTNQIFGTIVLKEALLLLGNTTYLWETESY